MYQGRRKFVILRTTTYSNVKPAIIRTATRSRSLAILAVLSICPQLALHAETQWVKARLGPFETISDSGRKSAIQGLSQFEQFRFALGAVMGVPELRLDPPLRILVFRNAQELASQACVGFQTGRDRVMT